MKRGSLRLRLLSGGVASIVAALLLSALALTFLFQRHVERRLQAELRVYLNQATAGISRDADGSLLMSKPPGDPRFSVPLSGLYWQVELAGTVLRSRSLWDARLGLPADFLADGTVHRHRIPGPGGGQLIALERGVGLPASLGGGTMRAAVAIDAGELDAAVRAFAMDLIPYLAVLAIFLAGASYLQVTVGLRPLARLREKVAAVRDGRQERLGDTFPNEVLPLTSEVDALIEARERQVVDARARSADLAHGLKTPLQVLAGDVRRLRERAQDDVAADIEQVANAMRRHVDRELARGRIATRSAFVRCDVRRVVQQVVDVVRRTPEGSALRWTVDAPEGLEARIDAGDLAEAVGNLVENAARHARSEIRAAVRRERESVVVAVTDDGAGIPAGSLDAVLARGTRLDSLGSGAGLGLSIVLEIAEACGGELSLRNRREAGLEAKLSLPARSPAADDARAGPDSDPSRCRQQKHAGSSARTLS